MRATAVFERLDAVGDETRSRILAVLEEEELSVSELVQVLQLPQSTVSRHLRVLTDGAWLTSRSEGSARFYRMAHDLPAGATALWSLVRGGLEGTPATERDGERTRAVLSRREERSRAFFRDAADGWDEVRMELYGPGSAALPLHGLLDPGCTVADLGAGTGELARSLAPFVDRVIAVDRSTEMLAAARERTDPEEDGRIDFREGELGDLPLDDGEADVSVLSLVLHHVSDPAGALAEAARVTRSGGLLLVVDMRPHGRVEYRETMGHLWLGFGEEEMEGWLEGAGFEEARIVPLPPVPEAKGPLLFLARAVRRGGGAG